MLPLNKAYQDWIYSLSSLHVMRRTRLLSLARTSIIYYTPMKCPRILFSLCIICPSSTYSSAGFEKYLEVRPGYKANGFWLQGNALESSKTREAGMNKIECRHEDEHGVAQ